MHLRNSCRDQHSSCDMFQLVGERREGGNRIVDAVVLRKTS